LGRQADPGAGAGLLPAHQRAPCELLQRRSSDPRAAIPRPSGPKAPSQEKDTTMRLSKSKTGGMDVWIGEPTKAEEQEFYRRFSGPPLGYVRGDRPNLGKTQSPAPVDPKPRPASKRL